MTSLDTKQSGFHGLGIAEKLLSILDSNAFTTPTPIQEQSIPTALEGKDIIGIAQTGTGKTLAFGIPMIQRLATIKGMGLVVLPTRELALQVNESIQKIGRSLGLRSTVLIGGENMGKQIRELRTKPHILIVTPGRLIDHLEQKTVSLTTVSILILDEADRMLDMGFAPQIKSILQTVPKERQTMLFSATMPHEISQIAIQYMKLPVRVEVAPAGTAAKKVTQEVFFVPKNQKPELLKQVINDYKGSVLVFSRTKFGAKRIAEQIRGFGVNATEIHSNRSLNQRIDSLKGFKTGKYRVMVATDIAARGIDVTGIEVVVNYDLPENPEDYVHRIGRTGRAEMSGHAISFATPEQKRDIRDIERLIRSQLPVTTLPKLAITPSTDRRDSFEDRPRQSYGGQARYDRKPSFGRTSSYGRKSYSTAKPAYDSKPAFETRKPRFEKTTAPTPVSSFGNGLRFGGESVGTSRLPKKEYRPGQGNFGRKTQHGKPSFHRQSRAR